jgi:hypothetical protein
VTPRGRASALVTTVNLDISWIETGFGVGGRLPPGAAPTVAALGIRRILDLRAEDRDEAALAQTGIELLHLPTPDQHPLSADMLREGVRWVGEALERGEGVLVHCQYGIGRSPLLCACVLVSRGETAAAALSRLKSLRRVVSPSPRQLEALLAWERSWHEERGLPVPLTTAGELGRIVWRW